MTEIQAELSVSKLSLQMLHSNVVNWCGQHGTPAAILPPYSYCKHHPEPHQISHRTCKSLDRRFLTSLSHWNGLIQLNLHKTAEVCQVINEVKQLADIIRNGWTVWIHSLQMLFIHFTDSYRETRAMLKRHNLFAETSSAIEPQISGKFRDDYHENRDITILLRSWGFEMLLL